MSVLVKRNGKHVGGLSKDDFSLFEDGKKREIATFEEALPIASGLPWTPLQSPRGQYSNASVKSTPPVTVLVLDAINTRILDQTYARQQLVKFLADVELPQGQPIALMVSARSGLKVIHNFTTDPSVLVAALKAVKGAAASQPGAIVANASSPAMAEEVRSLQAFTTGVDTPYDGYRCDQSARDTARALRELALALRGIAGRKTVMWATSGFPFECPLSSTTFAELSATAFRELADADVSVYPIDARGLLAYEDISAGASLSGTEARNPGAYSTRKYSGLFSQLRSSIDSLKHTAEMTGGVAFYNTNDLATALHNAMGDASTYYLIGYYQQSDGVKQIEWRSIQVRSRVAGVSLRHRPGLYLQPPGVSSRQGALDLAQTSPLDFSGVAFRVIWPPGTPATTSDFEIEIDPKDLTVSDSNQIDVEFLVVARTDTGDVVLRKSQTLSGHVRDLAEFKGKPFRFTGHIDQFSVPVNVRFILRDSLSERMGSITVMHPPL